MPASDVRLADGAFDFSAGVDSGRVAFVQSKEIPNGLPRNMLAWLDNGTVRGGNIEPRTGWIPLLLQLFKTGLYQGGYLYEPDFAFPYLVISVSGNIYSIQLSAPFQVVNLSQKFNLFNPANVQQIWMTQGEQFLIIQAGDYLNNSNPTKPLFWDGATLRRSKGITNGGVIAGTPGVNEIPAAGPMIYFMGRLWYAQGRTLSAGDIVFGGSGTAQYNFKDAILEVTENPLAVGGDGFAVPTTAGNITGMQFAVTLDTTTGQGPLYVSTRKQIYQLNPPITRALWIAANNNNQPLMTVAQIKWGSVSDRCMPQVNGDIFYQSVEPGIRSLFISIRYFQQWGNKRISRPEDRILRFNNRALLPFANGIEFDNRLLMAVLPITTPVGVGFQALVPLDFDIISQFGQEGTQDLPPAWEGMLETPFDTLQLFEGDFGGLQRAFAVAHSRQDNSIAIWEFSLANKEDGNNAGGTNRINWLAEFPAFDFGHVIDMKALSGGEIWIDQISGTVELSVDWRVDSDPCWQTWFTTSFCTARNQCEANPNPLTCAASAYPQPTLCDQGQRFPITFPKPHPNCNQFNFRPGDIGFLFQPRIRIKGWCRIVGLVLYAEPRAREVYENLPKTTTKGLA